MDRTNKSWKGKHGLRTTLLRKLYRFLSNVFLKHQYKLRWTEWIQGRIKRIYPASIVALYPEPSIFGIVFRDMCRIKHIELLSMVFVFQRSENKSKTKLAFFGDASAKTVSGHSDFMQCFLTCIHIYVFETRKA